MFILLKGLVLVVEQVGSHPVIIFFLLVLSFWKRYYYYLTNGI